MTAGTWTSALFVGSMSLMWGLINSLQIIANIPLLNVVMPANASIIYKVIYRIANFQNPLVIPVQQWLVDRIPDTNFDKEALYQSLKNAGLTSTNPFTNITLSIIALGVINTVLILGALVSFLISICKRNYMNSIVMKALIFLKKKAFWNLLLRYSLEVYLEMIISFTIKVTLPNFTGARDGLISVLAYIVYALLLIYIFVIWKFLYKKFATPHVTALTDSMRSITVNEVSTSQF